MIRNKVTRRRTVIASGIVCLVVLASVGVAISNYATSISNKLNISPHEPECLGGEDRMPASTSDKHDTGTKEFKPDELLVRFRRTVSVGVAENTVAKLNAKILRHFPKTDVYHLRLGGDLSITSALETLKKNSDIEYAEPDYVYRAGSLIIPNDDYFSLQWGLHNTGQTGGTPDADIDAPEAWDVTTGSNATVVAVIDTGIDYTHADLTANIWRNPGEIPGNGIDDDGNGYVDDVYGMDAFNHDSDPRDDFGHGTHCAGIIGAVGNNSIGVAGVNWNASIMALKFLNSEGYGYTDGAIECIEYAVMMKVAYGVNVRVLSNSWGGGGYSLALYDAIAAAGAQNILFIASAGNSASDIDEMPSYPASYDLNNIVSVAATDYNDNLAYFSNWGASTVDVGAPGVSILSTMPMYHVTMNDQGYTLNYSYMSGTSMACPHVSGLSALILALHPSYSYVQAKTRILSTVDVLPSLNGSILTDGRINAWRALTTTETSMCINIMEPTASFTAIEGVQYNISAWVHTVTDPILGASVTANFTTGEPSIALKDDGVAPDKSASDGIYTASYTPSVTGSLVITVNASAPSFAPTSSSVSGSVKSVPNYVFNEGTYQWVELDEQTVGLCLGDDDMLTITSPFPINFYGDLYSNLTISSNGNINFENKHLGLQNYPIPSANGYAVKRLIGVFWDDLNMRTSINHGEVLCNIVGSSPNRTLVIEWKDVAHYFNEGSATFEILFYENSSDIVLQYQNVIFENPNYDYGASATIGIQYDPQWGTQYSYNTPSLSNGLALRFRSSQASSLHSLASGIMGAPENTVYYVRTGNVFDDSALGFVYGKSARGQNIVSQWNGTHVNQTTGKPLFSENIVTFGGRIANKVTKYYEDYGLAKIGFDENATHYMFKYIGTGSIVYAVAKSTYNPNGKDYFAVQAFMDGSRTVLIFTGMASAVGTYASGICFADLVWPHIADFGESYYIYCWEDLNGDGVQSSNEMSLKASGN